MNHLIWHTRQECVRFSHIHFTAIHLQYYRDIESLMRNIRMYNHLCPFLFCVASFSNVSLSCWLEILKLLGNNDKMKPEYQELYHNSIRPSITICPWARSGQSYRHTWIWHFHERKETVIHLVSTQHTYGFPRGCFPPLFFPSLLLGLRIQKRQLCPSIAPWRNNDLNKRAHSYRL